MYLKHPDQCYVNMQKVDFKAKIVTEDREVRLVVKNGSTEQEETCTCACV